jgi:hypothetical protein
MLHRVYHRFISSGTNLCQQQPHNSHMSSRHSNHFHSHLSLPFFPTFSSSAIDGKQPIHKGRLVIFSHQTSHLTIFSVLQIHAATSFAKAATTGSRLVAPNLFLTKKNPKWRNKLRVDYHFESIESYRVMVYDIDVQQSLMIFPNKSLSAISTSPSAN